MSNDKKHILVVGATGGIGNKVAETLLAIGYSIIGTYFQHQEKISNLKKYPNFSNHQLDLEQPNSIWQTKENIKNQELYAIINCGGICLFENGDIKNDISIWDKTIATNLSGNYYLAQIFKDSLSANGRFIMLSSTDSYYGGTITASYAAIKAGVNSLTKSLSLLLSEKMVRVNAIAPGWVLTPMIAGNSEEFLQKVARVNPLKRNAHPDDVAKLIKFLLSEDSDYLNGQVIPLEGGYTNQDPTLLLEEEINK